MWDDDCLQNGSSCRPCFRWADRADGTSQLLATSMGNEITGTKRENRRIKRVGETGLAKKRRQLRGLGGLCPAFAPRQH